MPSYNQPKLNANATWSSNAITFSTNSTTGGDPYGLFVNTNNTVYVVNRATSQISIWLEGSINRTKTISGGSSYSYSLFVTAAGDIYVDNGVGNGQVKKFVTNANTSVLTIYVGEACYGLFIDINDTLYCSMASAHRVVTKSAQSQSSALPLVAGTGCSGSASNMLYSPRGIFVDTNFDLYVADYNNNRIQLFRSGQLNATTVAGSGASGSFTLSQPSGIVLDADKYLFIVDSGNNRIIASGPNGFRCIVCYFGTGSALNQLNYPHSMVFDSYGNIFVADGSNGRIQKFLLDTNSCSKYDKMQSLNRFRRFLHVETFD